MSTVLIGVDDGHKKLLHRVARMQREKRVRFWRAFAVTLFFAVALSGNLFIGAAVLQRNFDKLFTWSSEEHFTPTGRMKRPLLDGVFCRNIVFDNTTGQSVTDKVERCDGGPRTPNYEQRTAPPQFKWGGR
jgi:hypothetical protein